MKTAIVLGTFDGLHKGHRAVIGNTRGFYTVAVTFNLPPKVYFGAPPELLMLPEDKEAGLKSLGVNEINNLDFSKTVNISPDDFFYCIKEKFSPSLISCGYNYRFGKGAAGDVNTLKTLCEKNGIDFKCAESVGGDNPVSSSALRAMVAAGDISKANEQIFGGFGFTGKIIHGDSRGTAFGFPTANQVFPENLVKPLFGVYKSKIIIGGTEYDSITNIGVRPTYKTDFIGCETFIKDFRGDIYLKPATLKFTDFVREEKKFPSREALINAVKADIKSVLGTEI